MGIVLQQDLLARGSKLGILKGFSSKELNQNSFNQQADPQNLA